MTPFVRTSGRAADQLRPVRITRHYTMHAEGTALLRCGTEPVVTLPAGTLLWSDDDPHDWQLDPPHPTTPLRAFWLATAP